MILRRVNFWWQILMVTAVMVFGTVQGTMAKTEAPSVGYHMGRGGPMAGMVPPPGIYIRNDLYNYSGESDELIPAVPGQTNNVSVTSLIDVFTFSWITDMNIMGGSLGLGGGFAYGRKKFWFNYSVDMGWVSIGDTETGTSTGLSDLGGGVVLGWHSGSSHWLASANVIAPVGQYDKDEIINMGSNRWSSDVGAAYTYLNLNNGFEASTTFGFVFSDYNPETDYKPGIEFHIEGAVVEHFSNQLSLGAVGYYYQQVTPDKGSQFEEDILGRLAGAGPLLGYFFTLGDTMVSVNARWYHEFSGMYRLEGDSVFVTFGLNL